MSERGASRPDAVREVSAASGVRPYPATGLALASVLIATFSVVALAACAQAQECVDYATLPRIVGQGDILGAEELVVDGDHGYVACGEFGFRVADLTDPCAPQLSAYLPTDDGAYDVELMGHYACVADRSGGVLLFDVADPANPVRVNEVATPAACYGLAIAGTLAYVPYYGGFQIVDLADPAQPVVLGSTPVTGSFGDVVVGNGYAFLASDTWHLKVIDVSDPSAPALVTAMPLPGAAWDLELRGQRIYLAVWDVGLCIIDVSDPAAPVLLGQLDTVEDFDYVEGIDVAEPYVFLVDSRGLQIIDVSDPVTPELVNEVGTGAGGLGVRVEGSLAYLAADGAGLTVVDVTHPDATAMTAVALSDLELVNDVVVRDDRAYVAAGADGLQILDLTDPDAPGVMGVAGVDGGADFVALDGEFAVVANGGGFHVIDVWDPSSPQVVASLPLPDVATGLCADGGYAFVSIAWWGVFVIDLADPYNPQHLGTTSDVGYPGGIVARYPWVFVNDLWHGLAVVDASDPADPQVVWTYYGGGGAPALHGSYLYAMGGSLGLLVFDILDPATPTLLNEVLFPGGAERMAVANDLLYAAGAHTGLQVLDVSDPAAPVYIGAAATHGSALAVAVSPGRVYQAAQFEHLEIFLPHCSEVEAVEEPPASAELPKGRLAAAPNPYSRETTLSFFLERRAPVELSVHAADGRQVARLLRAELLPGSHAVAWTGRDDEGRPLPTGAYFVVLRAGDQSAAAKVVYAPR